jgi:hypothetical protein
MKGMSAIYSPPGFEQAFKDSLRPNRTQAEIEANRKKHGIVYRDRWRQGDGPVAGAATICRGNCAGKANRQECGS